MRTVLCCIILYPIICTLVSAVLTVELGPVGLGLVYLLCFVN